MTPARMRRRFLVSVGVVLLLTAALKCGTLLRASFGSDQAQIVSLLSLPAPYIPGLTNRDMMWVAVGFELAVIVALWRLRSSRGRLLLVAFVGGLFAAYHLGLGLIGYQHPCGCLGGPLDWLHVSRRAYEALTLGVIAYFLIGSYGFLVWDGIQSLRAGPPHPQARLHPAEPAN